MLYCHNHCDYCLTKINIFSHSRMGAYWWKDKINDAQKWPRAYRPTLPNDCAVLMTGVEIRIANVSVTSVIKATVYGARSCRCFVFTVNARWIFHCLFISGLWHGVYSVYWFMWRFVPRPPWQRCWLWLFLFLQLSLTNCHSFPSRCYGRHHRYQVASPAYRYIGLDDWRCSP